ncbi:Alpha/Beta hydrolase protein [Myxozyma melibiosi]|uniref:Alpha/Beta hydrolase protein n=1 Tax=Myxozyma melibiosi TaxID=54550 RepID=A0ABR1F316_9ASCO
MGRLTAILSLPGSLIGVLYGYATGTTQRKGSLTKVITDALGAHLSGKLSVHDIRFLGAASPIDQTMTKAIKSLASPVPPGYNEPYEGSGFSARWALKAPERTPSDPILLILHGGGYFLPALGFHVHAALAIARLSDVKNLSVLFLDYRLAPENPYPAPLQDAALLYKQLTEVDKNSNIILFGDSAGGNLALFLLQHFQKPHPACYALKEPIVKPKTVLLVSPWVDLEPNPVGSFDPKHNTDVLSYAALDYWAKTYCADRETRRSSYVSAAQADAELLRKAVQGINVLLLYGEVEVLHDACAALAEKIGSGAVVAIEPEGTHDSLLTAKIPSPSTLNNSFPFKTIVNYLNEVSGK